MTMSWHKAVHLLELARIELVFAAVSHAWMVVFVSWAVEPVSRWNPALRPPPQGLGLSVVVMLSGVVAAGLAIYGIALNDVLDARRDRAFAPTRPIPAGRVTLPVAVVVSVLALLFAVAAAVMLGHVSVLLSLFVAAAILFYNATGKYLPAVGAISLGLIHSGAAVIPNPMMGFVWPVWLILTHVMVYAVVMHRIEGKRPRMTSAEMSTVTAGWAFVTMVLVALMTQRNALRVGDGPGAWLGPLAAVVIYIVGTALTFRGHWRPRRLRRQTISRFWRWAVLCSILMDAGWLLSAGAWWPAAVVLTLALVAWLVRRLIELLGHLAESPPGYRLGPAPAGGS